MFLFRLVWLKLQAVLFFLFILTACTPNQKKLVVGIPPWPSYEFTFLAAQLGFLSTQDYQLVELTSATSTFQAFHAGKLDVAFLSLDQVLTLVSLDIDVSIISIIDNSDGADALLAKPHISRLEDLRLKRVGYENKAAGALILDEMFTLTGLNNQTVNLYEVRQDEAIMQYHAEKTDALVVRGAVKQTLLSLGAVELLNSTSLTSPMTNVMVVRCGRCDKEADKVVHFMQAYYQANQFYVDNEEDALTIMSSRLQLYPKVLKKTFEDIRLLTPEESLMQLSGAPSNIESQAKLLSQRMIKKGMLGTTKIKSSSFINSNILERAIYE